MTKKRRHHTVPRFYVQRFANPKGRLVAYHRTRERTMGMSVNDAGVEAGFYVIEDEAGRPSEAVEEALAKLEGAAKGAMDRVSPDAFPPDDDDREVLAVFLALQSVRTREFRHRYELIADLMPRVQLELQIGGKSPDEVREYMRDRLGEEPTEDAVRQVLDFRDNPEKYRVVPHPNESIAMIGDMVRATIPVLMEKVWHLCTSEERVFLTSDHPVALWRKTTEETKHLGVGVATADLIYFPLDPNQALVLRGAGLGASNVIGADSRMVKEINAAVARSCYEWIWHHPKHHPLKGIDIPKTPPTIEINDIPLRPEDRPWPEIRDQFLR